MTAVHANRMLLNLREQGLIEQRARDIFVKDVQRMKTFSGFDPNYLHLDAGKIDLQANAASIRIARGDD